MMMCFCECEQCLEVGRKTKVAGDHCENCFQYMCEQEAEFQFIRQANAHLESAET